MVAVLVAAAIIGILYFPREVVVPITLSVLLPAGPGREVVASLAGGPYPSGRAHSYLAGAVSGEITLMQFALTLGDTGSLKVLIEHLVAAAPERKELANLRRLLAHDNKSLAKRNNVAAVLEAARDP
jgi:hypothetical protein